MEKITIFTHGSAKENLGPAAVGVYVVDAKDKVVLEVSEAIGNATNDYAEYFAVVRGLQSVVEEFGEKTKEIEFELKQENLLVNSHLNAEEQIKDVSLIGHFIEIYNLRVASFPNFEATKVKRKQNKNAVGLANDALNKI